MPGNENSTGGATVREAADRGGSGGGDAYSEDDFATKTPFGTYQTRITQEQLDRLVEASDGATVAELQRNLLSPDPGDKFKIYDSGSEKEVRENSRKTARDFSQLAGRVEEDHSLGLARGTKISSQKQFEKLYAQAYDKLARMNRAPGLGEANIVPIYKIRRALGNRLTRGQFDRFSLEMSKRGKFNFLEESVEDSAADKIMDSMAVKIGSGRSAYKVRAYAQRG